MSNGIPGWDAQENFVAAHVTADDLKTLIAANPQLKDLAGKLADTGNIYDAASKMMEAKYKDVHPAPGDNGKNDSEHAELHGEWIKIDPRDKAQLDKLAGADEDARVALIHAISKTVDTNKDLNDRIAKIIENYPGTVFTHISPPSHPTSMVMADTVIHDDLDFGHATDVFSRALQDKLMDEVTSERAARTGQNKPAPTTQPIATPQAAKTVQQRQQ
jgi:hypothetical protein